MRDELDEMVVSVRADTQGFARDVALMRAELEGPFGDAADRAGRALESTLARALRTGKLGFEDLGRVALGVLNQIAASAVKAGVGSILSEIGGIVGLPGRATGGPVSPGRAYVVGERGPEVFVPTSAGQVAAPSAAGREVRVTVNVNAAGGNETPRALERSSRQVARAVRRAVER
ncbi:tail tape measure protein [Sphingomonas sp. ID1715]|uniref:tail tape measure protein n=1 Tax=Sphingomonas sp. ID1715 TaxID=1656898 RepID=UPI001489C155|nr:tail tape measure protein [Sphingomonas sp. ID1715]NNM76647.1 tail tape measure protein [Sphingomonas sp. ID1715]